MDDGKAKSFDIYILHKLKSVFFYRVSCFFFSKGGEGELVSSAVKSVSCKTVLKP